MFSCFFGAIPDDRPQEEQLKSAVAIFFLCLLVTCALNLVYLLVLPAWDQGYNNGTWIYWNVMSIFGFACCVSILFGIRRMGLTLGMRLWCSAAVFICVTMATFGNPRAPYHFFYSTVLNLLLVFRKDEKEQLMNYISQAIQIWVVVYVTIMVYTEGGSTHFGSAFFPLKTWTYAYGGQWFSGIVPVLLNYQFLKWYFWQYRKKVLQLEMAAKHCSLISECLANYDVDKAKELLQEAEKLSTAQHSFHPEMLHALSTLLENLRTFRVHLPPSLFAPAHDADPPNTNMSDLVQGKRMDSERAQNAVNRLRDPSYSLEEFRDDVEAAFPELQFYNRACLCSSGWSGFEEYQRSMGAMYSTYCLARLDIDGKEIFTFGVDGKGMPCREPHGENAAKQQSFYNHINWSSILELTKRAGLLYQDSNSTLKIRHDRMLAFLALTAVHDIMKNPALLPTVQGRHAPYEGYAEGSTIVDHDLALAYVMEHFPQLLPSFEQMGPGQRAPMLFAHGKMGFNNGWLVQGEAPPGALFSKFKRAIMHGGASENDVSFYFVHWLTDLAGAEPYQARPWPGAEKFVAGFPLRVLMAFLESFAFVQKLATKSEVEVMEDYLQQRWKELGPPASLVSDECVVAAMRLALMAQGFEADAIAALQSLPGAERKLLSVEFARTACQQQFREAPLELLAAAPGGPALLVYYAPALVQKAGPGHVRQALRIIAEVLATARRLFPLDSNNFELTACIRIDALKVLTHEEIEHARPWHLRRTSRLDAEAARGPPQAGDEAVAMEPIKYAI